MIDFSIPIQNISFSIFPNNSVFVENQHTYDSTREYAVFEWFEDYNRNIVASNIYKVSEGNSWKTEPLSDGKLTYYRLVVPKFADSGNNDICWNEISGKITLYENAENALKEISLKNAFEYTYNNTEKQSNESYFYPGADMFLLGNIKKCLTSLQTDYITNKIHGKCIDSVRDKRDLLHVAIEVIKYLLMTDNYADAQRILDDMSRLGCEFACEDMYNNIIGCGCGRA